MTVQRRAPLRPKLPAVCRALIDHQRNKNYGSFENWLSRLERGGKVRLCDTMLRGDYVAFYWWFAEECAYPQARAFKDETSERLRRRRDAAVDAYTAESIEKLAAHGLWPIEWLSGNGPLSFARRGATRLLTRPLSFAEVLNYASMLPTLNAAFDACTEVLERARVRCRGRIVMPFRALNSGGIVSPENAPPANWGDAQTRAAIAAYELASMFGFRLTFVDATEGTSLSESAWSAGATLQFDVPIIWRDGEIGEEMRFARWLEESGSIDSPNIRLVAS